MKKQCGLKQNSALKKELLILFSQSAFSLVPNLLFFFAEGNLLETDIKSYLIELKKLCNITYLHNL